MQSLAEQIRAVHSLHWDVALDAVGLRAVMNKKVVLAGRKILASHDLHDHRSNTELPESLVRF